MPSSIPPRRLRARGRVALPEAPRARRELREHTPLGRRSMPLGNTRVIDARAAYAPLGALATTRSLTRKFFTADRPRARSPRSGSRRRRAPEQLGGRLINDEDLAAATLERLDRGPFIRPDGPSGRNTPSQVGGP